MVLLSAVPTLWPWSDLQIAAAYEVLADDEKRKLYDQVSPSQNSSLGCTSLFKLPLHTNSS